MEVILCEYDFESESLYLSITIDIQVTGMIS